MTDQNIPVTAPPTDPPATSTHQPATAGWRHRMFRWRSLLAVGIAALILGAAGGTTVGWALGADRDSGDHRRGATFRERGPDRQDGDGGPGQMPGAPLTGAVPPTTAPQQDDEEGGTTSGSVLQS